MIMKALRAMSDECKSGFVLTQAVLAIDNGWATSHESVRSSQELKDAAQTFIP